ncbi:hypothetical protein AAG614_06670 [Citromicrobium bathyomarinum]
MPTFFYEGSVIPDAIPLTLEYRPMFTRRETSNSPDAEFSVTVLAGRVRIGVTVEHFSQQVVYDLFVPAMDAVNALIGMAGFAVAIPYTAEIERVYFPDHTVKQYTLGDRSLAQMHEFELADLEQLADLAITDLKLSLLISDTLMTLGKPHYSPIACGRVTDGIARLVAPDLKGSARWEEVRRCLKVDEAFLKSLTDVSKGSRHADREEVIAEINQETAHRLWKLVGRFLRFRIDGALDPLTTEVLVGSAKYSQT